MQINFTALIPYGIGLAVLFFGYFFGLFEGRNQGYKKRRKEEAEAKSVKAANETPLPPPSPPVTRVENNLLKLALGENSQLRLEIDNQSVDTARLAPEQRKRLIDLMLMMRPWVDASAPGKTVSPSRPATVPPSHPRTMQPPPTAAPASRPASTSGPAAPTSPSKEEAAPTSMVGQIDAILQAHLTGTPLASLGIRLIESSEGGAIVMVGVNRYAGVGDVPDPEIQAAIRAAIAEWENKYTPGV